MTTYGDCRNGIDDPDSPVWAFPRYALPSGASSPVVHAVDVDGVVCRGHEHGISSGSLTVKDAVTIPDGYHTVCGACHRTLTEDD
jgi:hypothetical protein